MKHSSREYEQVSEVSFPGYFVFADNMRKRTDSQLLPYIGLKSDAIRGRNPNIVEFVLMALTNQFPNLKKVHFYSDEEDKPLVREDEPFLVSRPNGLIRIGDEYSSLFYGNFQDPQGLIDPSTELDKETLIPEMVSDEEDKYDPPYRRILLVRDGGSNSCLVRKHLSAVGVNINGRLSFESHEVTHLESWCDDDFVYSQPASYWRGQLAIDGNKPGKLLIAVINSINTTISQNSLPIWKAIGFSRS